MSKNQVQFLNLMHFLWFANKNSKMATNLQTHPWSELVHKCTRFFIYKQLIFFGAEAEICQQVEQLLPKYLISRIC